MPTLAESYLVETIDLEVADDYDDVSGVGALEIVEASFHDVADGAYSGSYERDYELARRHTEGR